VGIWSWFFPTSEDRLRRARAEMAAGQYEAARNRLVHCDLPEAEALYNECSAAIDGSERAGVKKVLAAKGFHGWKIEVSAKGARRKAELEKLCAEELARAGVDLDLPEMDGEAAKEAIARVQRRVRTSGRDVVTIRLVPIVGQTKK
jgi:hypothetical protein